MPDENPSPNPGKRRRSRLGATLKALVRTRVTAGLLVVLPLYVTWAVAKFIFTMMRDASHWAVLALLENRWVQAHVWKLEMRGGGIDVDQLLQQYPALDWGLAIFSVFLTILLLYAIGLFTANILGQRIVALVDLLLERLPLVKTVYRASKQILAAFGGQQRQSFQRVVLFPLMAPGVYSIGFVTNLFKDATTGEEHVTIFYSSSPFPTTGFVFILKRTEVVELDWSVEDALKAIMSGGILLPPKLAIPPGLRWHPPTILARPAPPT